MTKSTRPSGVVRGDDSQVVERSRRHSSLPEAIYRDHRASSKHRYVGWYELVSNRDGRRPTKNILNQHFRASGVSFALAVLMISALTMSTTSPAASAYVAASSRPACAAKQIIVSAGVTLTNTTYPHMTSSGLRREPAHEAVPIYFHNRGPTCHLLMGAPAVQAVRDTHGVTSLKNINLHDLSVPVSAVDTRRRIVAHHQTIEVLFVVVRPIGSPLARCSPATTSGILIQGYATPIGTFHYVERRLQNVCFDAGVGPNVLDYGVAWPSV